MNAASLEVRFQPRCTPAVALQRLSTVLSHQRAPLLDLQLERSEPLGVVQASVRFGDLSPAALEQITRRLARDWSVMAVEGR